jgi:hypothetical protein
MSVAFVLLGIAAAGGTALAWAWTVGQRADGVALEAPEPPPAGVPPAPAIDAAKIAELAHDGGELSLEAIEAAFAAAHAIEDAHLAELGGRALDGPMRDALVAAPSEHRGQLFRTRGRIEELRELPRSGSASAHLVRLRTEAEQSVWCAVEEFRGTLPVPQEFVRIDGLFVQLHPAAGGDAPLLVGPRAVESIQAMQPVRSLAGLSFPGVMDDSVEKGFSGLPTVEYWALASFARSADSAAIDWNAAPLLDGELMRQLGADGAAWRGRAVRLPACRLLDLWTEVQTENPLRAERWFVGWLGSPDWGGASARFVAPFESLSVRRGETVAARGFFLKSLGYTPRDGGAAAAPFFVLQSIEPAPSERPREIRVLAYAVGGSLVALAAAISFLLLRGRGGSTGLQADLARRRQLRRERIPT